MGFIQEFFDIISKAEFFTVVYEYQQGVKLHRGRIADVRKPRSELKRLKTKDVEPSEIINALNKIRTSRIAEYTRVKKGLEDLVNKKGLKQRLETCALLTAQELKDTKNVYNIPDFLLNKNYDLSQLEYSLKEKEGKKKRAEERGFKSSDSSINRLYITWLVEADANHHLAYLDDGIKWMLAAIGEHLGSFAGGIIARYEKEFLER